MILHSHHKWSPGGPHLTTICRAVQVIVFSSPGRARGITLIELLVVIALIAIVAGLAVPSMRVFVERAGVENSLRAFTTSTSLARAEAIKLGVPVVMCRSRNADTQPMPSCSIGSDWEVGWIVFADLNADGKYSSADGDVLLRAQGALAKNGTIEQNKAITLVYRPDGTVSSGKAQLSFSTTSGNNRLQRAVCIGFSGRARVIAAEEIAVCS